MTTAVPSAPGCCQSASETVADHSCQIDGSGCWECGKVPVEIAAWSSYSPTEKALVNKKARQRLALII